MLNRRIAVLLTTALLLAPRLGTAADPTVKIIDNVELSGTGVTSGSMFQEGADLAAKEINAAGGILNRKIDLSHQDNQSQAQIAKAVATKAADEDPYVTIGPIFSGDVNVAMAVNEDAGIPMIMGGEAAMLTQQGAKFLFRTSFSQANAMPKVASYMQKQGMKSVSIVWIANDFGKGGHDTMVKELTARGIKVAADISTEPGQTDYSATVVNVAQVHADALFVYMNEEESARFLIALRKLGYDSPVIGETVLASQRVVDLAGRAANGVSAHVGLSADAPNPLVVDFARKFKAAYGHASDHNGLKGYTAIYLIKAVTERMGRFDRAQFAATLHGARFSAKDYPGLLMDVSYDDKGDLDRESYLVEVKDGKQIITETLPPLGRK